MLCKKTNLQNYIVFLGSHRPFQFGLSFRLSKNGRRNASEMVSAVAVLAEEMAGHLTATVQKTGLLPYQSEPHL